MTLQEENSLSNITALLIAAISVLFLRCLYDFWFKGCRKTQKTEARDHLSPRTEELISSSHTLRKTPGQRENDLLKKLVLMHRVALRNCAAVIGDELVWVRHGERADHASKHWAAGAAYPSDPPLSTHGMKQAGILGAWLAKRAKRDDSKWPLTCVVTSPMLRCVETAVLLADAADCPVYASMDVIDVVGRRLYKKTPSLASEMDHEGVWLMDRPAGSRQARRTRLIPWCPFTTVPLTTPPVIPSFPESPRDFTQRIKRISRGITDDLLSALTTTSDTDGCSSNVKRRFTSSEIQHSVHKAGFRSMNLAARIVIVTHQDVVREAVTTLNSSNVKTQIDPSHQIPYCSMTCFQRRLSNAAIERHNISNQSEQWSLVGKIGETSPLSEAEIRLHFDRR